MSIFLIEFLLPKIAKVLNSPTITGCKAPTITSRQRHHTNPPKTSITSSQSQYYSQNANKPTITYSQHAKYLAALTPTPSLYPQTPPQVTVHHTRISYREPLRGEERRGTHSKGCVITAFNNVKSRSSKTEKGVAKSKRA